ncbi:class I SAM-dependent methyltransferase [Thauera sinica]|uniref:Class I SAM-dependent methyltransferase n=1 Tax=Thauera sinica TaxID=2665146 RepID=A0ABW1AU22_9RHOO|nr:methyltransferase domain-containing protein [Thauera sp. K11]ATE59958.1 SAM-dependent methyltransferase [Thauera sp. K11]
MSIPGLSEWLQTPQGLYLLEWEHAAFDQMVADVFGYYALQIGMTELDFLRTNRMPFRFRCAASGPGEVLANEFELPFAGTSLDLVLLPHVLEFSRQPHQVLREVERVLVPEGSVIISGFNPLSLWGVRWVGARGGGNFPWTGQYRTAMRIKDWLTLLGFEVQAGRFGCYVPAVGSAKWLDRWQVLDYAGRRWWPVCGAAYMLHGVKRVQGMRLITPKWRDERRSAKRLSPVAQRNGGGKITKSED